MGAGNISQLVEELAKARAILGEAKSRQAALQTEFETSQPYIDAAISVSIASANTDRLEAEIREIAKQGFIMDGEKHPHEKVTVKVFQVASITNEQSLRDWCLSHMPVLLKPDIEKVKKYAVEFGGVEGVKVQEEPRAQISAKL